MYECMNDLYLLSCQPPSLSPSFANSSGSPSSQPSSLPPFFLPALRPCFHASSSFALPASHAFFGSPLAADREYASSRFSPAWRLDKICEQAFRVHRDGHDCHGE